jgi:hypothetical protein
MVLVNNNNILNLNGLHQSRSANKDLITKIILNQNKLDEKYEETPEVVREPDNSYIKTTVHLSMKGRKSIYIPPSYEQTKKSYNTTMFDPSRKYSDK